MSSQIVKDLFTVKIEPIADIFRICKNHPNTAFTGKDSLYSMFNGDSIKIVFKYIDGNQISATGYYPNGNKFRRCFYNGNAMHGLSIDWHKNGHIKYYSYYENGVDILNSSTFFYDNGEIKLLNFDTCNSGNTISLGFYENGKVQFEEKSNVSNEVLTERYFYESGKTMSFTKYNAEIQPYLVYYENGNFLKSGFIYRAPFLYVGKWQEWYEDGSLRREYYFNDTIPNQREGTWTWWDEKGEIIKQEIYNNGEFVKSVINKIDINNKKD